MRVRCELFVLQTVNPQIEEIKNKLNILDIIGGYLKLNKAGINYKGICPFHSEKTPSFFVSPVRQTWHCFGCGAGSSIFDFVMKIEGIEFGDALRILAEKSGVELKKENIQLKTEREHLYEICELACLFFEKQMESSATGKEAEKYLLSRGITKESVKKWRLGYSPDTWNGLSDFLISKGYGREEIVKTGLAIKKEGRTGESYDRFRGRIIFPVFDSNSRVVGFGGRIFRQTGEKDAAKYINTPQTLLYDKSKILYGLDKAKIAIRKQNQCVVTEGYTDAIMCHQAGYDNTIAASGTALTSQHLGILKRYSDNLILAFDMDLAGDSATKRGINLAQEQGFNIRIVETYLKDSDPADIIQKDAGLWENALKQARSIMDYYFDSALASGDKNTPEGKKEIGRIILPAIKRLPNKIEQSHWIQKLSHEMNVREEFILEEILKVKIADSGAEQNIVRLKPAAEEEGRKKLVEEKIISLILKNPDHIKLINEEQGLLFSEKIKSFLEEIRKIAENHKSAGGGNADNFRKTFSDIILNGGAKKDAEFKNFMAALALKAEVEYSEDGQEEIELCLFQLKNIELKNKLNKISEDIKKAEESKNQQKIADLIEEFNKLTKKL